MSDDREWFYTRYVLSDGIKLMRGSVKENGYVSFTDQKWWNHSGRLAKDTFETREQAVVAAEQMRQRKIKSLQKQIAKLTLLRFE